MTADTLTVTEITIELNTCFEGRGLKEQHADAAVNDSSDVSSG